jgi:hypothetical protein
MQIELVFEIMSLLPTRYPICMEKRPKAKDIFKTIPAYFEREFDKYILLPK